MEKETPREPQRNRQRNATFSVVRPSSPMGIDRSAVIGLSEYYLIVITIIIYCVALLLSTLVVARLGINELKVEFSFKKYYPNRVKFTMT